MNDAATKKLPSQLQPTPMQRFHSLLFLLLTSALLACSSYEEPDSGIECGRQFINATYQGNFKRAKQLLLAGPEQETLLETAIEKDFRSRDSNGKEALSKSSIVVNNIEQLGDSVVYISYLNAYDNKERKLRIVNDASGWKTDLQYSFK
jgi:hypothetical protein